MSLMFHGLGKQDEDLKGIFDREWVKEQFSELLDVPRYIMMKTKNERLDVDKKFDPMKLQINPFF